MVLFWCDDLGVHRYVDVWFIFVAKIAVRCMVSSLSTYNKMVLNLAARG